jgi:hypothetical protein
VKQKIGVFDELKSPLSGLSGHLSPIKNRGEEMPRRSKIQLGVIYFLSSPLPFGGEVARSAGEGVF